jgi:hypothetical protein
LKILLEVAERNRLLGASEENRVSSGVCHSGRIYDRLGQQRKAERRYPGRRNGEVMQ